MHVAEYKVYTLQLVKLWTQSRLICARPSQTKFKSLTVNYSVGTHYVNFHYGLVSRLWFNAVHSSHMYDHKCIVLFTLPFHFQLNTKSQNGAFHFKLFSDFIFDLVMTPQNSVKLIKSCLAVHYGCTFIFHVLQHFHITLSRSCEATEKRGCDVLLEYTGTFRLWGPRLPGNRCDEIHLRRGHPLTLWCNCRQTKKRFLIWILTPCSWYAFLKSRHERLLVTVRETSAFFQSIPQEKGNSDLSVAILPVRDV